jgi:hypothetical protein
MGGIFSAPVQYLGFILSVRSNSGWTRSKVSRLLLTMSRLCRHFNYKFILLLWFWPLCRRFLAKAACQGVVADSGSVVKTGGLPAMPPLSRR